jgi:uncharacterized membrane protein YeaQ/YmgE (transglycosylase-associated protein family)
MTGLISAVIIGLIVGAIARGLMPGKQSMGMLPTILLGIVGSLLATYGGQAIGWYSAGQAAGWIASIVGALVVLFIYGKVTAGGAKA